MSNSESQAQSDLPFYVLAVLFGAAAGAVSVQIGDLLFTALLVVASCMLLGVVRPRRPWRWVVLVGICVPIVELLALWLLSVKPDRAQVYESFLAFVPGIAAAYGGSMLRRVVENLLGEK